MSSAETARVTTFVAVSPDDAFAVFTDEIDRWWRRGPHFRSERSAASRLCFEQDAHGRRLVERSGQEATPRSAGAKLVDDAFEIGRVRVWEPGRRLVFEWRAPNFAADECTEVEVRFEASGEGTRVTLEHRGWDAIRGDHPVRHGQQGRAFAARMGGNWGELMTAYRLYGNGRRPS